MEFLQQALAEAGYLRGGKILDDALVRNQGLIRDRRGKAIARLERAANGVDVLVTDYNSGRVLGTLYL